MIFLNGSIQHTYRIGEPAGREAREVIVEQVGGMRRKTKGEQ
jgi:hypothetical protein